MRQHRLLYAAAIFLSSSLLFLVEPMAGKRLLPLLGGSAAVWITCLVFFQTALLAGYLCAHGIATRLRAQYQPWIYGFLLLASVIEVLSNLNPHPHASTLRPIFSVLWVLARLIGLPFLVLSATNPLLQAWYARRGSSNGQAAAPPYRLFALSNFASLLALIVYPVLVEPYFSLHAQTLAWSAGFVVFALVCGLVSFSRRTSATQEPASVPAVETAGPAEPEPTRGERTLWLLMAACGALLLSAVTSHLSQNIA
ncbi:MAG TPA: hypothetical protein VFT65_08090, partial [Candidatus Angelobacter sp.]|nr:hypothetical protein [Candidatus Angelobacter sp.]